MPDVRYHRREVSVLHVVPRFVSAKGNSWRKLSSEDTAFQKVRSRGHSEMVNKGLTQCFELQGCCQTSQA